MTANPTNVARRQIEGAPDDALDSRARFGTTAVSSIRRPSPVEDHPRVAKAPLERGETLRIKGVRIDRLSRTAVVAKVFRAIEGGRGGRIATVNVDQVARSGRNRGLLKLLEETDVVTADGVPLVWASRIMDRAVPERVAGSDLIWDLARGAVAHDVPIFLLGGPPGAAQRASCNLEASFPGLTIAGTHCPPMGFDDDEANVRAIAESLSVGRPVVVFCGLGFPKQELLIQRLHALVPEHWFVSCGATISMVAGDFARAPRWMRQSGTEWLFRLAQEPRRLAGRYLIRDLPFAFTIFWEALRKRARPAKDGQGVTRSAVDVGMPQAVPRPVRQPG
jgi:N-acetylglucosaminyldiphosphoundecaprenol N-acetyl-beta-D-mannosaminyltransferase